RRGPTLLALDNLEQLEPTALPSIAEWLSAAPELVVVATSRVRLGIAGEVVYRVPPLSTARGADGPSEAIRLFEDRAAAVRGPFTEDERTTAERIVVLLEGMPLALEMAATRLAVLSPRELLDRIGRPLAVLDHGARDDPDRYA